MPYRVARPRNPHDLGGVRGREKFGIAPGYLPGQAYQAAHMDIVQAVGARWIRLDLNWALCEPTTKGTFDWSVTDAMIANASTRGLRVLFVVQISVPSWARGGAGTSVTLPTNPFDFSDFVNAAQARYSWIKHWEIGNEINLANGMAVPNVAAYGSPASTATTGKAYAYLMRAIYPRLKKQDPDCVILSSGLAGTDTTGGAVNDVEFYLDFYDNAGQSYFDVMAAHPYTQPLRPGELYTTDSTTAYQTWSAFGRVYGYPPGDGVLTGEANAKGNTGRQRLSKGGVPADAPLSSLRQVMTSYGDAHKKVWITEIGSHTGTGGVTQAEQVEHVKRAYALAQAYEWIGPVFWYSAKDLGSDGAIANSWGLVTSTGTNKTAYATYQNLALGAVA
jgi:hypothetical protein